MKSFEFIYEMKIPVKVLCSDDGEELSIDAVCAPDEDKIYEMIDSHAAEIKAQAEKLR